MRPVRLWIGLVLLALGVFGVLDAMGALDADATIGRWWPVGVIGLGLVAMLTARRISFWPVVIAGFGLILLADAQNWATGNLIGPAILVLIGGAVLTGLARHRIAAPVTEPVAVFGGVKILVPRGWRVSVGGLPIFGGYDDKTTGNGTPPPDAPLLKVNATAIFGGVEVANDPK